MNAEPTLLGIAGLAIIQLGKTAREWIRDGRRHRELLEQAKSSNRKITRLQRHLEEKGIITPDPSWRYASEAEPVTDHGLLPGLTKADK